MPTKKGGGAGGCRRWLLRVLFSFRFSWLLGMGSWGHRKLRCRNGGKTWDRIGWGRCDACSSAKRTGDSESEVRQSFHCCCCRGSSKGPCCCRCLPKDTPLARKKANPRTTLICNVNEFTKNLFAISHLLDFNLFPFCPSGWHYSVVFITVALSRVGRSFYGSCGP